MTENYKTIEKDYRFRQDIFTKDSLRVRRIKYIISCRLSPADRIMILMYSDCQSLRQLAKRMGLSHKTLHNEIKRIRQIIKEDYEYIFGDAADSGDGVVHR